MNDIKFGEIIILLAFIGIMYSVCRYFWTLMSEVKKSNRYLEAQTKLLAEITVKNGVDADTVSNIIAQSGINKIKL